MFIRFNSVSERREYGTTYLLEFQYCRKKRGTEIRDIMDSYVFWKDDSIYADPDEFSEEYRETIGEGIYGNRKRGALDTCGINYYTPEMVEEMIRRIEMCGLNESNVLLEWLKGAEEYNGMYILGI